MSNISIRTTVNSLEVTGGGYNAVDVWIDGLDTDDVLKEVGAQSVIDFFGEDELLESMDEDVVRKYFGIEEKE